MSGHRPANSSWGTIAGAGKATPPKPALATNLPVLEERTCACGCQRTFKVMPTSTIQFASWRCERKLEQDKCDAKLVSKVLKRPLIDRSRRADPY